MRGYSSRLVQDVERFLRQRHRSGSNSSSGSSSRNSRGMIEGDEENAYTDLHVSPPSTLQRSTSMSSSNSSYSHGRSQNSDDEYEESGGGSILVDAEETATERSIEEYGDAASTDEDEHEYGQEDMDVLHDIDSSVYSDCLNFIRGDLDQSKMDHIILDYLVREGHAEAVEHFLQESMHDFSSSSSAQWCADNDQSFHLRCRSRMLYAMREGDIMTALEAIREIDEKFFDSRPKLLLKLHIQQFIEIFRAKRSTKHNALAFAQSHLLKYLLCDSQGANPHEDAVDSSDVNMREVETVLMFLAFPLEHVSSSKKRRKVLPRDIQYLLKKRRRTELGDTLNRELLVMLGAKSRDSNLKRALDEMVTTQQKIVENQKGKNSKSWSLSVPLVTGLV